MAASLNTPAWQEWMSGVLEGAPRQTHAATLPAERFYCLLDQLPLHLLPRRSQSHLPGGHDLVFLNPDCMLCCGGELPEALQSQRDLLAKFELDSTIAWVRDSATRDYLPFWLGPKLESLVRGLRAHEPISVDFPRESRELLLAAGVLTSVDRDFRQVEKWKNLVDHAGSMFRKKNYAPTPGLIHPFHLAALRRYYRQKIRSGAFHLGDSQSNRRLVAHNDPVARFFHRNIAVTLSAVAGEPVKPSYVYMASYMGGAELKKHTDRQQCEFSLTLCLDFSPEPRLETSWPIRLQTPSGTVAVYQALGDALAYRGTRVPHYRTVLPEGQTSTSMFFHYVREDFAGPLD